ncbi:MAG: FumA C-terminus/TtdB family hydratase beta subunit [Bdellovibrionota bacterium]
MIRLEAPFTEDKIRNLKMGDMVEISGIVFTGRDTVHKWLHEGNDPPISLRDGIIYHCGPVVLKKRGKWIVTAAGPTTSSREEPYQAGIIERLGVRAVIGKGGMGEKTRQACQKFGCVYLHAVGGAAQVLAECVREVKNVYLLEKFGSPEAIWELEVQSFPVVVTIDAHGNSLHKDIEAESSERLKTLNSSGQKS